MPREKRKPGGQPDNKNALKHGFYAKAMKGIMGAHLRRARELHDAQSVMHEVAAARAQLSRIFEADPDNHDIIVRMLRTIAHALAIDHNLSRNEETELGTALTAMLAELALRDD